MPKTQSVLSLEYIRIPVAATVSGVAIVPTSDVVQFAFPVAGQSPVSGDWVTGSWETLSGVYLARCLVGPAGTKVLTPGAYDIWVKPTDNPEVATIKADELYIV